MLCDKCFKYHAITEYCKRQTIICKSCGHKQQTMNKQYTEKRCSVCSKYVMDIYNE